MSPGVDLVLTTHKLTFVLNDGKVKFYKSLNLAHNIV
jgi:hypothetical protein